MTDLETQPADITRRQMLGKSALGLAAGLLAKIPAPILGPKLAAEMSPTAASFSPMDWAESVDAVRCSLGNFLGFGNAAMMEPFQSMWKQGGESRQLLQEAATNVGRLTQAGSYPFFTPERRRVIAALSHEPISEDHLRYFQMTQERQLQWNYSEEGKRWRSPENDRTAMPWPDHLLSDEGEMHQSMHIYL